MSSTPSPTVPSTLRWSQIVASGEQSVEFLQGQLTQDLTRLDGEGRWSLLLRPDSVVITTCFVERSGEDVTLTVPADLAEEAHARLRRFLLRVRCTLSVRPAATGPFATTEDLIVARWPGVNEFSAQLTPRSFGAHVVEATVSLTKGCFTGQELVGRMESRGASVPWRLVHATGPDEASINDALRSKGPDGPSGVTTAAARDGGIDALGFAHRTLLEVADALGDVRVEVVG